MSNEYTMTLSAHEIATLSVILRKIGGDRSKTIRKYADSIADQINNIFKSKIDLDNYRIYDDITFSENSINLVNDMVGDNSKKILELKMLKESVSNKITDLRNALNEAQAEQMRLLCEIKYLEKAQKNA